MDPLQRVDLHVVPIANIYPHEIADPFRARRIEERLRADRVLRDPLLVASVPGVEGYVLLDGTNRLAALHALTLPLALVQTLNYADPHALELRTWCHAVDLSLDVLLERADAAAGLAVFPLPPLESSTVLRESDTFAVVLDHTRQYAVKRTNEEISRLEQLRQFVSSYEDRMTRLDCDADEVEQLVQTIVPPPGDPRSLVAFPPFTRSQVVAAALRRAFIPAGITRHVILIGRALRVNLPLEILTDGRDPTHADTALRSHLRTLHPRWYQEPTVLFDS